MCVCVCVCIQDFPHVSDGKESACDVGDLGLIPGSGRYTGEGNGNPLQYSCLENSMDGGSWQATVHGLHIFMYMHIYTLSMRINMCVCMYMEQGTVGQMW